MARATYLAPGVYVEEVPSAQQPIAGVGTSTVGFIGIVLDVIYYPVPNPNYDPVAAKDALSMQARELLREKERATSGKADASVQADIDAKINEAKKQAEDDAASAAEELKRLEPELAKAKEDEKAKQQAIDAADAAVAALNKLPKEEKAGKKDEIQAAKEKLSTAREELTTASRNVSRAETAVNAANARRDDATQALKRIETAQAPPAAPAPGSPPPKGSPSAASEDETDQEPESGLLTKSDSRPYYLEKFIVAVEPGDTKLCTNFTEYTNRFGPFSAFKSQPEFEDPNPDKWQFKPLHPGHHALTHAVNGFFNNGGTRCFVARITDPSDLPKVLQAFDSIDELSLVTAPGLPKISTVYEELISWSENRENTFAILDSPGVVSDPGSNELATEKLTYDDPEISVLPRRSKNAAFYFPHIEVIDPAKQLQDIDPTREVGVKWRGRTYVPPSGHVAGIYARTDEERGVHKAPANTAVRGAVNVKYYVSQAKQAGLNPQGVNCIRNINGQISVWGARTIGGDRNYEWKYVSVRRLFLFVQESIDEGTQWVVFEPNDPALWGKIRLNVSAFLTTVWRNGALFGLTPEEAFYVKCDAETNPPEIRDLGRVVTEIGVAIVRPAEFVIFRVTQATAVRPS